MIKRAMLAAVISIAAGGVVWASPAAADPIGDLYIFHDRTADFVAIQDPAAFGGAAGKKLVVSPFGTLRVIECRGDGHYVAEYCRQFDDAGREHGLYLFANPIRNVYIYNPF